MSLLAKIQKLKEQLTAPQRRCECSKASSSPRSQARKKTTVYDPDDYDEEQAHLIYRFTIDEGRLWLEERSDNLPELQDLAFKFRSGRFDPSKRAHYKHFVPIAKHSWRIWKNVHGKGNTKDPTPGTFEAAAELLAGQFKGDVLD